MAAIKLQLAVGALAAAILLSVTNVSLGAAGAPRAHAAGSCALSGHEESLGPTYVTAISVSGGASCGQALKLVRSYYRCRVKHGGITGSCSGVEGFRCKEVRFAKIKVQYNARVTCTRGRETIRHEYTQFT